MSDASVLKRKLAPPLAKALADCAVETLLRKTMPRDADRLFSLDLVVDSVDFSDTDKTSLVQGLKETELVFRLTNDKGDGGLCIVSPELLAGLIEIQLYGYVTAGEVGERKPTRTDGIVVASLVDAWMTTAQEVATAEDMEPLPFTGFVRGNGVLDQRNAGLLIEPGRYAQMSVKMSLGDDAKTGMLTLAWPAHTQAGAVEQTLAKQMERHLLNLDAPLHVVLARIPLAIERVRTLAVDDVIEVPAQALVSVKLEGIDGTPVGTGRLGQVEGKRAVRLNAQGGANKHPALMAPSEETPQGAPPDMAGLTDFPDMTTEVPEMADVPSVGELNLPDLPDLPDAGGLPDLPDLPDAGGLPDLPDLPDMPAGDGALPDLPELPDLPDLPDLP